MRWFEWMFLGAILEFFWDTYRLYKREKKRRDEMAIIREDSGIPIDDLVYRKDDYINGMAGSITYIDPCSVCSRIKYLEGTIDIQDDYIHMLKATIERLDNELEIYKGGILNVK